jgi:ankyrin repeat protein
MLACSERADLRFVRRLLASGVDVEARDEYQLTALHHAANSGRREVLRALIVEHNADMFARDIDGKSPFDLVVFQLNSERRKHALLLQSYRNKMTQDCGRFALHVSLKVAQYSFPENRAFHPPLNPLQIRVPLGTLTVEHWRTLFQSLDMELIGNRDDNGKLPIHIACQTNAPVEVLSLLVDLDPTTLQVADHSGNQPLHECCFGAGDYSSVRYIVEQGGIGRSQSTRTFATAHSLWINKSVMAHRPIFDSVFA